MRGKIRGQGEGSKYGASWSHVRRRGRILMHRLRLRRGAAWRESTADSGVLVRSYGSYREYVRHQTSKLGLLDLADYEAKLEATLAGRLLEMRPDWSGTSALCLGARLGAEVRAFHRVGAFALGIDLNPGRRNRYVLLGDFHHIQFPNGSIDCVYTNALDHALDVGCVLQEVRRVLRPDGVFLLDVAGTQAGADRGSWEATVWRSSDSVLALLDEQGFSVRQRVPIEFPDTHDEQLVCGLRATD